MKKIICALLFCLMIFTFSACGEDSDSNDRNKKANSGSRTQSSSEATDTKKSKPEKIRDYSEIISDFESEMTDIWGDYSDSTTDSAYTSEDGVTTLKEAAIAPYRTFAISDSDGNTVITNDDVKAVYMRFSELNYYYIELEFTAEGESKIYKATSENLGKALPISVDGAVISNPIVNYPISGNAMISGGADEDEILEMFELLTE